MDKIELQGFEFAVVTFNKILEQNEKNSKFEIVWETKFGPAFGSNIIYSDENKYNPIMHLEFNGLEYSYQEFEKRNFDRDFFACVHHNVYEYFKNPFGGNNESLNIVKYPHYLMDKLLSLSKIQLNNELNKPNYSSVWDFKTLDNSIELPFINDDSLIIKPLSLISTSNV
ncbi:MAG: hypothetical protein ACLR0O_13000 [Staphylococcus aureus]